MKTIEKAISNAAKAEFLEDIVFEGRNHNYGAYTLRKNYSSNLLVSLISVSAFAIAIVLLAFLHSTMNPPAVQPPDKFVINTGPVVWDSPKFELPEPPAKNPAAKNDQPVNENVAPVIVEQEVEGNPPTQVDLIENTGSTGEPDVVQIEPPVTIPEPVVDLGNTTFDGTQVTTQALFMNGSVDNFRKWLVKRINYPEEAVVNDVKGKVFLKFTIDKTGKICDISLMRGVHPAIDQAAIDALKRSPKWTAATIQGNPVRVSYVIPIAFCIEKN
jgi:periplasmic protein TonB